jgi:glycosyltransferase involved in cell wall biosynthesis
MMVNKKVPKILLTYDRLLPFVERDLEIFKKHHKVRSVQYNGKRSLPKLAYLIARANVNFSWFALGYATSSVLLSKMFRKKSVVIAGGWDVIYLPEIDYGAMNNPRRRRRTEYALRKADRVLAVSESTKKEVLEWVDRDVDVVYNGVDTEVFMPKGEKEDMVITVAGINNLVRFRKKGIETVLKVAEQMPETRFVIVGENSLEWDEKMKKMAPENAVITGRISDEELLSLYHKAKVYAQISYHESFGVALAEGMSCGCVPVVTRRFALPEVVGDTGFYAEYGDVPGTVEAIKKALESGNGNQCRERVLENFSMQIREERLLDVVREVLSA